ncbi:MAG: hypothetical protein ABIQ52_13030 [Vicinamibacterales bacterium]
MALLAALFATVLLMALGVSVLLLGSAEITLASHDRDARALTYASRAAAEVAAVDLAALPSWSGIGSPGVVPEVSATPGTFVDSTLVPSAPWGGAPLDLRVLTTRLQTESAVASSSAVPVSAWRLFEYGALSRLIPEASSSNPYYLVVWVAVWDDVVVARAVAYGPGEARSITELTNLREVGSGPPERMRRLTVRPGI